MKNYLLKPMECDSYTRVYQLVEYVRKHQPYKVAYRQLNGKKEELIYFDNFANWVDYTRAGLYEMGLTGKHIAIIGETSAEWIATYLAVISGIGVCVPIDRELPPETMAKQITMADVEVIFCSERSKRKLAKVLPLLEIKPIVIIMRSEKIDLAGAETVMSLETLHRKGVKYLAVNGSDNLPTVTDPDETCVIIFTSGTTGANKGVMLSNTNILSTLLGCARLLSYTKTSFSVLPVNHSYELHAHLLSALYLGTTVCINDDLKHILKNIERFRPEMSCMVPMMLDLIVKKLKAGIEAGGKKEEFEKGVKISRTLLKMGIDVRQKIFAEVRKPLGGRLRMIICGGAALAQDTIDFLHDIGIEVYNGYGITECAPVAAVNPKKGPRKNSVGLLLPTMIARIVDVDENGNGEIQLRGNNVMNGYYKLPEDTAAVFTEDGWFRTGDIGHIDADNFLYMSGRIKNLIILSNGKNIYPEEIEEYLMKSIPYIQECVVYSDDAGTGIFAMIFPDKDFCTEHNLSAVDEIKEFMADDMKKYNASVPGFKRIMDFDITDKEFEKSSTRKIQRFKISKLH